MQAKCEGGGWGGPGRGLHASSSGVCVYCRVISLSYFCFFCVCLVFDVNAKSEGGGWDGPGRGSRLFIRCLCLFSCFLW